MSVFFNENEWMWKENQTDNFPIAQYGAKSFMWTDALYNGNFVNALSQQSRADFLSRRSDKISAGIPRGKEPFQQF